MSPWPTDAPTRMRPRSRGRSPCELRRSRPPALELTAPRRLYGCSPADLVCHTPTALEGSRSTLRPARTGQFGSGGGGVVFHPAGTANYSRPGGVRIRVHERIPVVRRG